MELSSLTPLDQAPSSSWATQVRQIYLPQTLFPSLQNIAVISVILGDYHFGALTATGKLLTWGKYLNGALGLSDPTHIEPGQPGGFSTQDDLQMALNGRRIQPPKVDIPTPVRFDYGEKKRKNMFCFATAAAGWHMGALVIKLEVRFTIPFVAPVTETLNQQTNPNDSDEDSTDESGPRMPGHYDTSTSQFSPPPREPREAHFFGPPAGVFRIGFAGRGSGRWFWAEYLKQTREDVVKSDNVITVSITIPTL